MRMNQNLSSIFWVNMAVLVCSTAAFLPSWHVPGIAKGVNTDTSFLERRLQSQVVDDETSQSQDISAYEVCLSPGCVADGANEILAQMEALSEVANINALPGKCCSLCGNGPIVLESEDQAPKGGGRRPPPRKIRKVTEAKLLELLFEGRELATDEESILEGFRLFLSAQEAQKKEDYTIAADQYQQALQVGREAALRSASYKSESDSIPTSLKWVLACHEGEATSRWEFGNVEGTISSGILAREISNGQSATALLVLQKAYERAQDAARELEVLEAFLALPKPPNMSIAEENARRTLGFRLVKLQKQN